MPATKDAPVLVGFRDPEDGTLQFHYRSNSDPAKVWTTTVTVDGNTACNCIGWVTHNHCVHEGDAKGRAEAHRATASGFEAMSSAPTTVPGRGLQRRQRLAMVPEPEELISLIKLSNALSMAAGLVIPAHFDSGPKAFAAAFWAWERDVPIMTAFAHTLVINGKLEPDGQLMMGLIQREKPTTEWRWIVEPSEADGAHVELWIDGKRLKGTGKWTPADAMRSKQLEMPRRKVVAEWKENASGKRYPVPAKDKDGKDIYEEAPGNWQLWPTRMYAWQVVKIAARLGAPEIINGLTALSLGGDLYVDDAAVPTITAGYPPSVRESFAENPFAKATAMEAAGAGWVGGPRNEGPSGSAENVPDAPRSAQGGEEAPKEAPQATRAGTYAWLDVLQALRRDKFPAVDDEALGAIVRAEGADMMRAIDNWIHADDEFVTAINIPDRCLALMKAATRWQLDHAEQAKREREAPPASAQRSMLPEEDEYGFPR